MAATTQLITVEEFRKLPENDGAFYYELRHGEVARVTRPTLKHHRIQRHLRKFLEAASGDAGIVETELAYRALPEYELRVADVAWVPRERWEQADLNDNLRGTPDLVIEVLSPSNTATEIYDKEKLCLENGCREFWVVDPDRRQVKVSTPDGITTTFQAGQQVPLRLLGGSLMAVDAIFA
ncbi:MAG: Uma2 family endonuclease [Bryobacteraceae bacterium]